ncbi:MAG: DoxX family membrane protein [Verrucomicrobiota bacterium]
MVRTIARWALAVFFVVGGLNHFRDPAIYLGMMPPWLPWPVAMNAISGAAEILGGLGLLVPATRRAAGWGLLALLVAVFPANVHVALQGHMPGTSFSPLVLWLRLPFQLLFMLWVWWVALARGADTRVVSRG